MSRLSHQLAKAIRDHVAEATRGNPGAELESRFVFHGPPLAILLEVLSELSKHGGINLTVAEHGTDATLPVLLPVPEGKSAGPDPRIGESGICTEAHLLDLRDTPGNASFVALIPPGLHINASLDTTTEKLGIAREKNSLNIPFEQWWNDAFVQYIVKKGLFQAGLDETDVEDAMHMVEEAAEACDHLDDYPGSRQAAWQLIERLYSIPDNMHGLAVGEAVALACGFPSMQDGAISAKEQVSTLSLVAEVMADGFRTTIERLAANSCPPHVADALQEFLEHIRRRCDVPTTLASATPAFYLPDENKQLQPPSTWWKVLTVEQWLELLDGDPPHDVNDLEITCTNAILPIGKGQPAIVLNQANLNVTSLTASASDSFEVRITGGGFGSEPRQITVPKEVLLIDKIDKPQRTPTTYKVESEGFKTASTKVVSLENWVPGIFVACRTAIKTSFPKKTKNRRAGAQWEASMSLPGAGRYEFVILTSPNTNIVSATGVPDEALGVDGLQPLQLEVQTVRPEEHMVEVEADGKMAIDVSFIRSGSKESETCRILISCEEIKEDGCRSEFERLIRANREHLDKAGKAVIQLDRNARISSLQAWLLEERSVARSFLPIAISDDYAEIWAPPNWNGQQGPVLSSARFLRDPRPESAAFVPPEQFSMARSQIAERIRSSTGDHNGLIESAPLGSWMTRDKEFRELVEQYLDAYTTWFLSDRDTACWVDTITVYQREGGGRTLNRVPDAVILSPLHPIRLAWHCLAQQEMHEAAEGRAALPCPAASVLDPDCVPDSITLSLQSPGGIELATFVSLECNSDYWSVLWHGKRLGQISARANYAPFDDTFGLTVGGISTGFSPAQVGRALGDVSDILGAKPILSVAISSAGGTTDACNEGLAKWSFERFGNDPGNNASPDAGKRFLEIYDIRDDALRPDDAVIANLSEDTDGHVRWYTKQPENARPDLGIIAQLDSIQPDLVDTSTASPLAWGGLARHRVRRQLQLPFLSESRQARLRERSGDGLSDKVVECLLAIETPPNGKQAVQFSPNVHAITQMLEENSASFVAVSSSAVDPACFLGGVTGRCYLWDYDLPAYSSRAGDTSGYYLLSQVRDSDRETLGKVLELLPGCKGLPEGRIESILLEVARRGIPTVRGLSGDDTGATGDLGLFLAVRLLQDQFRTSDDVESLLPVLSGRQEDATIALIIPVDPFRGYLADLARSLGRERKETSLSRPDLLVVGIRFTGDCTNILLTPVEVKCRQGSIFSSNDAREALGQAKAMSALFHALEDKSCESQLWKIAYQHLLLSMIGFGLRVYSQHPLAMADQARWADFHERIAATLFGAASGSIRIDDKGRLVIIDASPNSDYLDIDGDGMPETIVISGSDASRIALGDAKTFYDAVKAKVGHWQLLPDTGKENESTRVASDAIPASPHSQGNEASLPAPSSLSNLNDEPDVTVIPQESQAQNEAIQEVRDSRGIILSAGHTVDGFEPRQIKLNVSDTRLNQLNIGVVGDLGTGKTQLLKSLIYQITKASDDNRGIQPRFLIFDYKRDYSNPEFLHATGARVARPYRLPLNLFDTSTIGDSAAPWLDRFRFFADVLDKVYSGIGPVQRDKLKGAVRNAYESVAGENRQPTIYDVHAAYKSLLAGKSDSPMSIIDDLVDMEVFEPDPTKTCSFDDFLSESVVVSLDALGQDDRSKNMLVAVMLNMFYENMLRTPKRPFVGTSPQLRVVDSYLLVDEADNIMRYEFDVLRKLLLQGREFGTGVILASQYLRHFKTGATDYREPLLTWFIHKVPNVTPAELGALGFTSDLGELSDRVKTLPNHHCLYKSFDVSGEVIRGLPFYEIAPSKTG